MVSCLLFRELLLPRVGGGHRWGLSQRAKYDLFNSIDLRQNFVVPKPQHLVTLCAQPAITPRIVSCFSVVLPTIDFYHQFFLQADKINNVVSNGALSAEFITINLTKPKVAPKNALCVCQIASQLSRPRDCWSQLLPSYPSPVKR